jgi:fengycin family lipopeptide synthetase D
MQRVEKLIFEQAERTPAAIAVEHNGARLTYRDLRGQALEISAKLKAARLLRGEAVAVYQRRSLSTLSLMLGIWDAGGVVVPVSPNTPPMMFENLVHDLAPRFIFNPSSITPSANGLNGTKPIVHAEDVCYVIYTSGSEGRPKGVVGSHESLIHYLRWQAKVFGIDEADRFSQTAPLSFDFSLKELLVPLICGARVCIADRNTVIDARKFVEWVRESEITLMCCVPTLLRAIVQLSRTPADRESFRSLRAVLISGDMLRWEDVADWRARFGNDAALFNLYGPTESTVIKLWYSIPEGRVAESINVPVGRPIDDTDILVLDENDEAGEAGEIGEVVILSDWIARGYLNANGTSAGSFCYLEHDGRQRRAYRTGDLGRWLTDGSLELMGRKDRQVKIRGYRIELNEIESALSSHPDVNDVAAVTANGADDDGLTTIACFFTAENGSVNEKELRHYARERLLPQVLSLTRFHQLDKLPLTTNGKVDRFKLESMIEAAPHHLATHSGGETVHERISAMWKELLALEAVNADANFFELGGDSMTAIRLLRRLRQELHPEVKLDDVYEFPSIAQLSNRVEQLLA